MLLLDRNLSNICAVSDLHTKAKARFFGRFLVLFYIFLIFYRLCVCIKSSRPEVFCTKGFLRNFAEFT